MKRRLWVFLPLAFFLALIGLLAYSLGKNPDLIPSARKGEPVPAFSLPSLLHDGASVNNDVFKGHWTLLNVWATWCPTCHVEHAYLMQLAGAGVRIVGMDYKDDDAKARAWIAEKGNPYVELFTDRNGDFGLDLGVYGAPETFLIDPAGRVVTRHVGNVDADAWERELKPLMGGAEAAP